ncbi:MAG TPA: BON domain-containing protein [Pirellulales bacterium]|nr:BON domain-containing protein [Pirellulales bacterium]
MYRIEFRDSAEEIEAAIKSQIRCRLGQCVRALRVDVREECLVLSGLAPSYYAKQLAQHIAMNVSSLPLANEIEVGQAGAASSPIARTIPHVNP